MNASQLRNSLEARERDAGSRLSRIQKDLMDMLVKELKEELEAHDQPKTGNNQQGVAAPKAARRDSCARAHLAERGRAMI